MAASTTTGIAEQMRVRLHRETLLTLHEWQGNALRRGGGKPTYGKLLDAAVALVAELGPDVVGRVLTEEA